jgi:hypothetical protein
MHVLSLLFMLLAACSSASAAAPPGARPPADPGALAALARDTAVALGLVVPAMRDRLQLDFELDPAPARPRGLTIIRVVDRDHHRGLRVVISDHDPVGPRAIAAWPL